MRLDKLLPFLGIRGKLLVAFVALSLGPVVLLGSYLPLAATRALMETNADHLRLQLLSNVGHIESYVAALDASARMLARWVAEEDLLDTGTIDAAGRERIGRLFYHFAEMRPDYYQIRLLSALGIEQVRINRHGEALEVVPVAALQDKSDR